MFPLKLLEEPKTKGQPVQYPPPDETCFIVAKNGIFKQISNPFYSIRIKSQTILAGLAEASETKSLKVDKLPFKLFSAVEAFFTKINATLHGEAIVVLAWNPVLRSWLVKVPAQKTSGLSVQYDMRKGKVVVAFMKGNDVEWAGYDAESKMLPTFLNDYTDFGTIHSHCEIGAFHSGTDDKDEAHFDGLHITVGMVHRTVKDYAARWILCGQSFKIDDLGTVVDFPPGYQADECCINQVKARDIPVEQVQRGGPNGPYALDTGSEERMRRIGEEHRQRLTGNWGQPRLLNPTSADFDKMDEEEWNRARNCWNKRQSIHGEDRREMDPSELTEREINAAVAQGGVWSGEKVIMPGEPGYLLAQLDNQSYNSLTDDELNLREAIEENEDLEEMLQDNEAYIEVLGNRDVLEAYLNGDMNAMAGIQFEIDRRRESKPKGKSEKSGKAPPKPVKKETVACLKESPK